MNSEERDRNYVFILIQSIHKTDIEQRKLADMR